MDYSQQALDKHRQLQGKISIQNKDTLETKDQLSTYYTPGVAAVSEHLSLHPEEANQYTWKGNSVAVVSDGSAVLGLGNIGPVAALPVMEGKSMLFKHYANIDAVPIILDVHTADEIVAAVRAIAPTFGGINLEDIAAPLCFEVEDRLKAELSIPVFHDDQHGTAVVVLAGIINALQVTNRQLSSLKIVVSGVGAAGTAVIKLLHQFSPTAQIIAVDSRGIISPQRTDLNQHKRDVLQITNPQQIQGGIDSAIQGADIFIGVSKPGALTADHIRSMNPSSIIFALANPTPEILPDEALAAGAAVVATGRSDFPNQVNNSLVFPGIFRGALDHQVSKITDQHKLAAAHALAALVTEPSPENIIPDPFTPGIAEAIAQIIR